MEFSNNIGGFIAECVNFKYSAEAYEITKLSKEIELGDHYLESLQFAAENALAIQSGDLPLTESFFTDDSMSVITEAAASAAYVQQAQSMQSAGQMVDEKKDKLGSKIIAGLLSFFAKLGRFFMRIASKFIMTDEMEKLITAINNTTLDEKDLSTIVSAYDSRRKKWNFSVVVTNSGITYKNGSKHTEVTPRFKNSKDNATIALAKGILWLALNDKVGITPKQGVDMVSPLQLLDISTRMEETIKGKEKKNLLKEIEDYFNQAREKGIMFNITNNDLTSVGKEIEVIKGRIEELKSNNKVLVVEKSPTLGTCYTKLIAAAGNLMSAVAAIAQFRNDMIPVLQGIVENYSVTNKKKAE